MATRSAPNRIADFFDTYTKDLKAEDLQRLFTRDTREAYQFFTRGHDAEAFKHLAWHTRAWLRVKTFFVAFTMRLSPARRIVYAVALFFAATGMFQLLRGVRIASAVVGPVTVILPGLGFPEGTLSLFLAFGLMNLLVLLEVADRLSLKNDLEIARQIQQAMLPSGQFAAPGVETAGVSRPANTVGGDFFDVIPLDDGRIVIALGDVAGKGSPAALLMALLLAMLRTLVDEKLEPPELMTRLNVQVCRQTPRTRFITLFYAVFDPRIGELTYVSAGHTPPLLLRKGGSCERLTEGGIALGMFDHSTYTAGHATLDVDDLVGVYSDGITEAENPAGTPFDEAGLESALKASRMLATSAIPAAIVRSVEQFTADTRLADDLTILVLRRRLPAN